MPEIKVNTRTVFREDWQMNVSYADCTLDGVTYHTDAYPTEQKAGDVAMADLVRRLGG